MRASPLCMVLEGLADMWGDRTREIRVIAGNGDQIEQDIIDWRLNKTRGQLLAAPSSRVPSDGRAQTQLAALTCIVMVRLSIRSCSVLNVAIAALSPGPTSVPDTSLGCTEGYWSKPPADARFAGFLQENT